MSILDSMELLVLVLGLVILMWDNRLQGQLSGIQAGADTRRPSGIPPPARE